MVTTLLYHLRDTPLCPTQNTAGIAKVEAVSAAKFFFLYTVCFALLFRLFDLFDKDGATCGYLAPITIYRLHKHWRPVLDPAVALLVAFLAAVALVVRRSARHAPVRNGLRLRAPPGEVVVVLPDADTSAGKDGDSGGGLVQRYLQPYRCARLALHFAAFYAALLLAITCLVRSEYPQCRMIPLDVSLPPSVAARLPAQPGNALHEGVPLHPPYPALDVMVAAVRPTCINQQALASVLLHLRPRRILVVAPGQHCARFESYDPRISCMPEDDVTPGITVPSLAKYLKGRALSEAHGLHRAGWYMQQFCKLLFYRRVPDLSDHFLIWDSDMIMTSSFRIFNAQGQVRQHTGGIFVQQYAAAYFAATGDKMLFGPRWESFVVHHLVVYKPFLHEMLQALGFDDAAADVDAGYAYRWATAVLDRVPDDEMDQGLTEYGAYVSHVLTYHRAALELIHRNHWWRDATAYTVPHQSPGHCCPEPSAVARFAALYPQYEYFGFELGHLKVCGFDDERYKDGYFPPGWHLP
jgi:hypothetical protein